MNTTYKVKAYHNGKYYCDIANGLTLEEALAVVDSESAKTSTMWSFYTEPENK